MLRITAQKSTAAVKKYYERSDYYEEGPNALKGYWFGRGAERLGLEGEVNKTEFERVVDNLHPFKDESLTPRTRSDRRVGWDFTFSVSKSVSVLWALTEDHRILDAIRESVNETLAEIEEEVLTRVHVGRNMHTEKTGNLIAATWLHSTSRPVKGAPPMPGLHVHAWVGNATFREGRFQAADISGIKKDAPYFEARFHSRLAEKLTQRFHLAVERQGRKWFEIAGFPRDIVERFSERLLQIEEVARKLNIVDPKAKDKLGALTRESKVKTIAPASLPKVWREMLSDQEFDTLSNAVRSDASNHVTNTTAKEAVDFAIEHRFAGHSTVRERELLTDAIWRGIGDNTVVDIEKELGSRTLIRDGKQESAVVTTPEVLQEERWMLHFARRGLGSVRPLAEGETIRRDWLSDEQKKAVQRLWNNSDVVMILAGKAGTGKTTLAEEAVEGMERNGRRVVMVAPTTKAVEVLQEGGFQAHTLAKLLTDKELKAEAQGGVIWLDEASLASSMDIAQLFGVANELNARVVLAGDRQQHSSIGRGRPLELLEDEGGIKPITINTIRRQLDEGYRRAVEKLSQGNVEAGFEALEKLGAVRELPDDVRDQTLAKSYADAIESGESALVIAPSLVEKETVTRAIREELRSRGRIETEEHNLITLKPYTWTTAERSDARLYSPGDVIEFHARGRGGFSPGDRVTVEEVHDSQVRVSKNGAVANLPLDSAKSFAVYRPITQAFSRGDVIKITRNRRAKPGQQRLANGTRYKIEGFTDQGKLLLSNGVAIDAGWGHYEHGVVSTSFSSQGDTTNRVFIAQSAKSFGASSPQQLYVSASRGRVKDGLEIYTDDVHGLRQAVSRDRSEMSATELARRAECKPASNSIRTRIERLRHIAGRVHEYVHERFRQLTQSWQFPSSAYAQSTR